jgi:hypothetical protein
VTDIRKHGFESVTQWREHLDEIDEATGPVRPLRRPPPGYRDGEAERHRSEVHELRRQVHEMRERLADHRTHRRRLRLWSLLGGGAFLLLLTAAAR